MKPADEVAIANEYEKVSQVVIDDLTSYARTLPDALMRAGATDLLLQIIHRKSAPRRRARKES
jgi:hypothetical protein